MKQFFLLLVLGAGWIISCNGQYNIQPILPASGMVQKSQLWNILVINIKADNKSCLLELIVRDRTNSMEVLTATTNHFTVSNGSKQLTAASVLPIQYNNVYSTAGKSADLLMVGSYTACYRLMTSDNKTELAQACVEFDADPLSPPMLSTPADSSRLAIAPSQFTWIPPTPSGMFDQLHYEVMIAEILPGQKAAEAIQQNLPFHSEPYASTNMMSYTGMLRPFEKEKWYAWQVVARDNSNYGGKSEVWVFSVDENTKAEKIIKATPFVQTKSENPETAIAPNGILKISYNNRYTDTSVKVTITDLANQLSKEKQPSFTTVVKRGDNRIQMDLKKVMEYDEGKTYQAQIINSKGEKWTVLFVVRKFDTAQGIK